VKRKLGVRRTPGSTIGLTLTQAEAELRRAIQETAALPPLKERLDFGEVASRYVLHVDRVMQRKPTTIADYTSIVGRHLTPFFGGRAIERVGADAVVAYMNTKLREGLSSKTISNHLNLAHAIFRYALKRGWVSVNPVAEVDRPRALIKDPEVRFLTASEVELLLSAVPNDALGPTDRALYLTAASTGLRQGELVALRWRDVDRSARLIRVRRSYTRGQFGTPKSRRSSRAVPLAKKVADELESHFGRSRFTADDDLVFGHPLTGRPYDASRMRKRFRVALEGAGVRPVRFHDMRHTFGTHMAAAGAPLRAIQEWMGHRDISTQIYADYAPNPHEAQLVEAAFAPRGSNPGSNLSESQST